MNRRTRGVRRSHGEPQPTLFDPVDRDVDFDSYDQVDAHDEELQRDVNRMRLETSSNVYAQRRSQW